MADLSSKKWARYEPSLPGNAELPEAQRFYLEVAAGLSVIEYAAASDGFFSEWRATETDDKTIGARLAKHLGPFVRFGAEPLTLDGEVVDDLARYLQVISEQRAAPLVIELIGCFGYHNSYEGQRELFSVRSFGGTTGTASRKTEPAESQTAAR